MNVPALLASAAAAAVASALAWQYWPRNGLALYRHRFNALQDSMTARGLTARERQDEMQFRFAMARLRRRATDAVLKHPAMARDTINRLAVEESKALGRTNRDIARQFLVIVKDSPLDHILYRDGLKAVHSACLAEARRIEHQVHEDHIAAVTTLR